MHVLSRSARLMVALVAALHVAFFTLEMFFWDHPIGRKIFDMTPEASAISAPLAMQQALYNGFLVAGLIWGLLTSRVDVLRFFLFCVIIAGVFAALTVKPSIFFSQAVPGILALLLVWRSAPAGTGEMPPDTPLVRTTEISNAQWDRFQSEVTTENAEGFRAYVRFITDPGLIGANPETLRSAFRKDNISLILAADSLTFQDPTYPVLCIDPAGRSQPFRVPLEYLWIVENNVSIGNLLLEEIIADQVVDGWFTTDNM